MDFFANFSIRRKLTLIMMLTSMAALLLAGVAFFTYELVTFRATMAQNVSILAEIIGTNCRAALTFNDQGAAEEILSALAVEEHIVAARIYKKDSSEVFATFVRLGAVAPVADFPVQNGHLFQGDYLFLSKPIILHNEPIGVIHLQSDLRAMQARIQRYVVIVVVVLVVSLATAFALSSRLQQVISKPIFHLVQTARAVSTRKDYSMRASKHSRDELGVLVDSFNEMLEQIHEQDESLQISLREKQASLREKEVLLQEVHHRVKNNLQMVSSLLNLQSSSIEEPAVRAMFVESQNRVKSMAIVHEKLYQSKDLAAIDFAEYIHNLVNHLSRSYVTQEKPVKLTMKVENVPLTVDTAIPCGLVINELVSNAFKYAFPDGRAQSGEISVAFSRQANDDLVLVVKDNGVGLPADFKLGNSKSLGLLLVDMLAKQLRGSLAYGNNNGGAEFKLTFQPKSREKT